MPEYLSHSDYVNSKRRQVVETAQAMLDGQLCYLIGSRRLSALRHEVDIANSDADFLIFVGIDSDTDALPLGEVRRHWSAEALAKLEPEIQSAEAWAAKVGSEACRSLIARFAEQEAG
ncbi:DUF2489 domain-containing protein [Massilia sp. R2A-15]|uniref:DUF2489 domain-containing protein n=1 Tax=Massilia sp. R2A-15 TaxID=3064278 RepID=UPI0027330B3F|nr:DUF2489 domain-containing protein [Massilia sp. R2A-15]WLI89485.1 DUF2489 domain-containing protein [Massilia sp. R2A-15]